MRCLGHIINLAAKAFLFSKNADAFEDSTDTARKNGQLEALREEWKKQGPVGKLHNTVKFIRCTPQRREVFKGLMKDELPQLLLVSYPCRGQTPRTWHAWNILFSALVISDNDTRWNCTNLSIERALALEAKIRVYSENHKEELDAGRIYSKILGSLPPPTTLVIEFHSSFFWFQNYPLIFEKVIRGPDRATKMLFLFLLLALFGSLSIAVAVTRPPPRITPLARWITAQPGDEDSPYFVGYIANGTTCMC